jgi:hypothetical protein
VLLPRWNRRERRMRGNKAAANNLSSRRDEHGIRRMRAEDAVAATTALSGRRDAQCCRRLRDTADTSFAITAGTLCARRDAQCRRRVCVGCPAGGVPGR